MKISISIACYNQNKYLFRSIDSVLDQSYKDIEIIVVDDCSDKDGEETLNKAIHRHYYPQVLKGKIRFFRNRKNEGVARTQNFGLSKATGDYFSAISADSWYYPDALQKMVDMAKQGNDFVVSESNLRDKYGDIKKTTDINQKTIQPFGTFWSLSSIWSRSMHDKLQGFNSSFKCTEPEMFMRAFILGLKGYFIDEVLQGTLEHDNERKVGQWSTESKKQIDHDIAVVSHIRQAWCNAGKPIFKVAPKYKYNINNDTYIITAGAYNEAMAMAERRS